MAQEHEETYEDRKKIGIFPAVWKILFAGIFIKLRTPN